ncbi:hypothetical protein F3Y22_tig00003403pilonHSYRG00038 [Hibiscus syriacus]|uniref:MULE transposase domain-containing protein n=1 Tax=Hibiscus syriacus TaxID=106335 RepID=A0A6A3CLJ5_HIBSY|nr:hypothetical protein F3Y22_tig00003403pilonHSYRG00038 [Hibiscus syriacus]
MSGGDYNLRVLWDDTSTIAMLNYWGGADCAAERVAENVVDATGLDDIGDAAEQGGLDCDGGGLDDIVAWDGGVQDVDTEGECGIDATGGDGGEGVQEYENTNEDDEESDSEEQNAYSMDVPYLSDGNDTEFHDEEVDEGENNGVTEDIYSRCKRFEDTIRDHPKMKLKEIQRMAQSEIHVNVKLSKCRRVKNLVTSRLGGNMNEEFANLWDYVDELRAKNPGSTIKMARGRKEWCRPIIGVDGCFLKDPFKGIFLYVVRRDGNDQMYPIAWAVVEGERTDSWSWFLSIVAADLGLDDEFSYTIITDQHKSGTSAPKKRRGAEDPMCTQESIAPKKKK